MQPPSSPSGAVPASIPRYRRILVPLDGTELSETALPHAEALARLAGAELVVLRAYLPPAEPAPSPGLLVGVNRRALERAMTDGRNMRHASERYLEAIAEGLEDSDVEVTTVPIEGAAGEAIVREATAREVDLIVMATHARHGVGRLLAGSVAEHVLHHTTIPVYLVHPHFY
jgi:nucleotide-binding universal stress UspA family protein